MPTSQQTVDTLTQLVAQTQATLNAYQEVLSLAQTGWQQDQAAVDAVAKIAVATQAVADAQTALAAITQTAVPASPTQPAVAQ